MNRLSLCPLQAGYSVQLACNIASTPVPGGFSRYVRTFDADSHVVNVSYQLTNADYMYLLAFYRVWQTTPNARFLMKLLINDAYLHDYECVFVPNSLAPAGVNGSVISVNFSIEAYGNDAFVPVDVVLTSLPYPIEQVEALAASCAVTELDNSYRPQFADSALTGAVITAMQLRNMVQAYSAGSESIAGSAVITALLLRRQYQAYSNYGSESVGSGVVVTAMSMQRVLIKNTIPPENIQCGAVITGLILS